MVSYIQRMFLYTVHVNDIIVNLQAASVWSIWLSLYIEKLCYAYIGLLYTDDTVACIHVYTCTYRLLLC